MQAVIEMLKGDTIRRHVTKDKSGFVELGLIKDVIPVNNGINPADYGYIPNTFNASDSDEVDVIVLSEEKLNVGQEIKIWPIALIRREDGDDKVVAVDDAKSAIKKWNDIPIATRTLIQDFFSYHYKFLGIDDGKAAEDYVKEHVI